MNPITGTPAVSTRVPGVAALRARLAGGVLPAIRQDRPEAGRGHDQAVLGEDPRLWELLQPLEQVYRDRFLGEQEVKERLQVLAEHLGPRRQSVLAVLYSPELLLDLTARRIDDPDATTVDVWLRVCWIAEAVWLAIEPGGAAALVAGDRELLWPLAARTRFLVLSEPLRRRAQTDNPWLPAELMDLYGEYGPLVRTLGMDSWAVLIARCREARWRWQQALDGYQSHPLLAQASPEQLEAELTALVFATPRGRPLVVSGKPLGEPAVATADDRAVQAVAIERHLLPRFNLLAVARLAAGDPTRRGRVTRWGASLLVLAVAVAAGVLIGCGRFLWAAWAASAVYVLLTGGVVTFGRVWAAQWLLRLPAAATVGLVVLVALPPAWWQTGRVGWAWLLPAAAYGYLLVEARNHGVARLAALIRALGVAAAGAVHALLVCLVGLVLVAPAYADRGAELVALWQTGGGLLRPLSVLGLAAGWCLTVGVFSQILWEDRPITAPLAHLQWRAGR